MFSSRHLRLGALAIAVGTALALTACSGSPKSSDDAVADTGRWAKSAGTIVFGATPDKVGSDANERPLEDYIAEVTGYKVEYYPTADYTALIAAAVAGKIDVMSSGALQYVMAVNKGAKLTPVAAKINSPMVQDPGYYSEAIVPKGSSLKSLADAKGKKICFVDPNSTSGFLFGLYQLRDAGLSVDSTGTDASGDPTFSDFTAYFAGAHDKSEQTVASKQCDVGFAEDSVAEAGVKKGEVTTIGKQYVPGGPLSISTTLPAEARNKVTDALQTASVDNIKAAGVTLTDGFVSDYFGVQPETADYFKPIIELCTQIAAAKCAK